MSIASKRENGGILGTENIPTTNAASGIWSLNEVYGAVKDRIWPGSVGLNIVSGVLNTDYVVIDDSGYRHIYFLNTCTFESANVQAADLLIIGAGGKGGGYYGGGGGAGGLWLGTNINLPNGSYTAAVAAAPVIAAAPGSGGVSPSSVLTFPDTSTISISGGGSGSIGGGNTAFGASTGGSGGGGGSTSSFLTGAAGTSQTYLTISSFVGNGGNSSGQSGSYGSGGGGGANGNGANAVQSTNGGAGGAGKYISQFKHYGTDASNLQPNIGTTSATLGYYAGGGGGAIGGNINAAGAGGVGGGGNGGYGDSAGGPVLSGVPGITNTGGGGGGERYGSDPQTPGGSGIIAIRYAL